MKTAIIIHGMPGKESHYNPEFPSGSNAHWLPWLQRQLIVKDILAQTPEMPVPYNPEYKAWKEMFERFTLNEETILVGHSCGGGMILRYLSEENVKVGKVVLVAPWIDLENLLDTGMFDFEINSNVVLKTKGITLFSSTDDDLVVKQSIDKIIKDVKDIKVVEFQNYGHFCLNDMKTEEFPELLEECLK
jgi:predicted alpha/beta hydrolase family esterase